MSDRKTYRLVLVVTGPLMAFACGGSTGVTSSDPAPEAAIPDVQSGVLEASAHDGDLPADLDLALDAERLAVDFYDAVVTRFEVDRPFSKVAQAEKKHVTSLVKLYTKRLLDPPPEPDASAILEAVAAYTDLSEACTDAVKHEQDLGLLYDGLLATEPPADVVKVLERLQNATLDRHVEAFEKCETP